MGFFKRTSKKEKLEKEREKILAEAYKMSHINRSESDKLMLRAEDLLDEIKREELENR